MKRLLALVLATVACALAGAPAGAQSTRDSRTVLAVDAPTLGLTCTFVGGVVTVLETNAQFACVSGKWVRHDPGIYNVLSYGALGDGATDDTAAIQTAIAAAVGGVVLFPAGTYIINSDGVDDVGTSGGIAPLSNQTIRLGPGVTLKAKDSSAQWGNVIRIHSKSNIVIEGNGGVIDGNVAGWTGAGEQGYGIGIYGGVDVRVRDLTIRNCWGDGIFLGLPAAGVPSATPNEVHFTNVISEDNRRQGMSITDGINSTFTGCTFRDTGQTVATNPSAGVDIEPGSANEIVRGITFTGCVFENNLKDGIIVFLNSAASPTSGEVTISGCVSRNNGEAGYNIATNTGEVVVEGSTSDNDGDGANGAINTGSGSTSGRIIVKGNLILNSKGHGILAQSTPRDASIEGNWIFNATSSGIRVVGADGYKISDNYVKDSGAHGISWVAVTNSKMSGNEVVASSKATHLASQNIRVDTTSTGNLISDNQTRKGPNANKPGFGISIQVGSDNNYVFGNDFVDGGATGPAVDSGSNLFLGNLLTASDKGLSFGAVGDTNLFTCGANCLQTDDEFLTKTGPVYNVKAWGATGDGATDDTAAIQAAIDAVEAISAPRPAVYFPRGDYNITSLTVDQAVTLFAEGGWRNPSATLSKQTDVVGLTTTAQGVVVSGIKIDGTDSPQISGTAHGVVVNGKVVFDGQSSNHGGHGIHLLRAAAGDNLNQSVVNGVFNSNGVQGVHVEDTNAPASPNVNVITYHVFAGSNGGDGVVIASGIDGSGWFETDSNMGVGFHMTDDGTNITGAHDYFVYAEGNTGNDITLDASVVNVTLRARYSTISVPDNANIAVNRQWGGHTWNSFGAGIADAGAWQNVNATDNAAKGLRLKMLGSGNVVLGQWEYKGNGVVVFTTDPAGVRAGGTGTFEFTGDKIKFGSAGDTDLYRPPGTPDTLKTDDALIVVGALTNTNIPSCDTLDTDAAGLLFCGADAGGGAPNYSQTFTSQTSVSLTHNLGTNDVLVMCYDSGDKYIGSNDMTISAGSPFNVTVTFTEAQTGRCVVNGLGGNYTQGFTSQTTVSLTHNLGTSNLLIACYDGTDVFIEPNDLTIGAASPFNVSVTFTVAQTGRCIVNGLGAGSGAAGSDGEVQYNDDGSPGAEAAFIYDDVTNLLTIDNLQVNTTIDFEALTDCNTLDTDSDGTLSCGTDEGGVPGGATGDVQYNDGASGFAGETAFDYDDTTDALTLTGTALPALGVANGGVQAKYFGLGTVPSLTYTMQTVAGATVYFNAARLGIGQAPDANGRLAINFLSTDTVGTRFAVLATATNSDPSGLQQMRGIALTGSHKGASTRNSTIGGFFSTTIGIDNKTQTTTGTGITGGQFRVATAGGVDNASWSTGALFAGGDFLAELTAGTGNTIGTAIAGRARLWLGGTDNVFTNGIAFQIPSPKGTGNAVSTTTYGVKLEPLASIPAITSYYGVHIGDQTDVSIATNHAVYVDAQDGANKDAAKGNIVHAGAAFDEGHYVSGAYHLGDFNSGDGFYLEASAPTTATDGERIDSPHVADLFKVYGGTSAVAAYDSGDEVCSKYGLSCKDTSGWGATATTTKACATSWSGTGTYFKALCY